MENKIDQLTNWVMEAKSVVFLGGAGVSASSGLMTFRSVALCYQTLQLYGVEVEEILSYSYLFHHPFSFYDFLEHYLYKPHSLPNKAHRALFRLETYGYLSSIVTQNIDGLHQLAGSKNVIELHGSLNRFYCATCNKEYNPEDIFPIQEVPYCEKCRGNVRGQGLIRPDIVLYGEDLDESRYWEARRVIQSADVLIVGGTSLEVYPANDLLNCYQGAKVVFINKSSTMYDERADLVIYEPIEEVLTLVANRIQINQKEK